MKFLLVALIVVLVAGVLVGIGCATRTVLQVGHPAPDFTAPATDNKTVTLSALRGQWVVLYFYPKANTPGCTKEACSLRDGYLKLQQQGVVILGASLDTIDAQKSFKEKHSLPFDLLSDADKKIARAYGVLAPGGLFTRRETFIIDPKGNLARVLDKVDVAKHDAEILGAVLALKAGE